VNDGASALRSARRDDPDRAAGVVSGTRDSLDQVDRVSSALITELGRGGCVFACGNGGSALAAQHFTAELVGHFRRERPPVRGVALTSDAALLTVIANDHGADQVFSRQVRGLTTANDALLAFSTSGRSPDVLAAGRAARNLGALTVALTGGEGGELAGMVDLALIVPGTETARIQEGHLILIHLIAEQIDVAFARDSVLSEP